MAKVKDIRNFFNSRKKTDTPALVTSAIDDVSQSKLLIIENEIKKSTEVKKTCITNVPEKIKTEVGTYTLIHGTKAALECFNKSIKFIQSILFLEHPSTIGNSKLISNS